MKIFLTNTFKRSAKKLKRNQIPAIEAAIEQIHKDPLIGEQKAGDLAGIYVYKFRISNQLILLAYTFDEDAGELTLISFAPHENFYKNLKKIV